jgi:hypothetical protein
VETKFIENKENMDILSNLANLPPLDSRNSSIPVPKINYKYERIDDSDDDEVVIS